MDAIYQLSKGSVYAMPTDTPKLARANMSRLSEAIERRTRRWLGIYGPVKRISVITVEVHTWECKRANKSQDMLTSTSMKFRLTTNCRTAKRTDQLSFS